MSHNTPNINHPFVGQKVKAYKLLKKRKNGTLGPLFINARLTIEPMVEYQHEDVPTKGYAQRPGWHVFSQPIAPHLTKKNRVWCECEIEVMAVFERPQSQGGEWFLGRTMKVTKEITNAGQLSEDEKLFDGKLIH